MNDGPASGGEADPHSAMPLVVGPGASANLFVKFLRDLRRIIISPQEFFSTNAPTIVATGGLANAITFAIIVHWLAAFMNFVWSSTLGIVFQSRINDILQITTDVLETANRQNAGVLSQLLGGLDHVKAQAFDVIFGAGTIILTPFTTMVRLVVVGALVHAAVRFFCREHSDRPHSYAATVKILAYATAPWVLCVIPFLGVFAAWVLTFFAAVIGIRTVYRTTTGRSAVAVMFPSLLVMLLVFSALFIILLMAFNLLRLVF